jgi:acetoin utilization transport system permease protein
MKLQDINLLVRKNMKKNRSRTFMTVFAVAIGCSFLIVLASFAYGVQKGVVEKMMEEPLLNLIRVHGKIVMEDGEESSRPLSAEDVAGLEKLEGVKAVTRTLWLAQIPDLQIKPYRGRANVIAVDFSAEKAAGRGLDAGRMPESPHEVLAGHHLYDCLAGEESGAEEESVGPEPGELLDREMALEIKQNFDGEELSKTFTVKIVGIAAAPREWEEDRLLYISEELLDQIEQFTGTRSAFYLDPEASEETREHYRLEAPEGRLHDQVSLFTFQVEEVKPLSKLLQEQGFLVYAVLDEIEEINFYFLLFKVGLIIVGTIAVIIASIGIFNTMTMAVTERSQEIGIMKAVGAHPRVIKRIFLLESVAIGIAGALAGVAVAYLVSYGVNLGLPLLFDLAFDESVPEWFRFSHIPAGLVGISFLICVTTAVISGLRPAAKATRVDVLRALRRDL